MTRIRVEEVPPQVVAVVRRQASAPGVPGFLGEAAASIEAAVARGGGMVAGPLFHWYQGDPVGGPPLESRVGFAVSGLAVGDLGEVDVRVRPGALAAVALHVGPYDAIVETYRELAVWLDTRQLDPAPEMWEEYLSDPEADSDPATWQTRLVRPLA